MHESEKWSEVAQSCPTLNDLMDCSLRGSSVHGIFQEKVLEWGAIVFSDSVMRQYQKISYENRKQKPYAYHLHNDLTQPKSYKKPHMLDFETFPFPSGLQFL